MLRYSSKERSRYVALYKESSLSKREFAQRHGLNVHTLKNWLIRAPKEQTSTEHFVQVETFGEIQQENQQEVLMQFKDITITIQQASPAYIATLVRALTC